MRAVDGVSFDVRKGETLGLVGESGCGKTTLGKVILRLIPATSGKVTLKGQVLFDVPTAAERKAGKKAVGLAGDDMKKVRRDLQVVFQDPYASLNPRMTVGEIVGEGPLVHGLTDKEKREDLVRELLASVGLNQSHIHRYPHEFSGGQRQRIGIARALALNPDFIVCDEPVSALDVSIQSQVLNLLDDLQQELGLTYLFIAHNLAVVEHISDRVGVMYLGKIVELADVDELYAEPGAPVHGGAPLRRPGPQPAQPQAARHPQGRHPVAGEPAVGLSLPYPLLAPRAPRQPRAVLGRDARVPGDRARPPGRLPLRRGGHAGERRRSGSHGGHDHRSDALGGRGVRRAALARLRRRPAPVPREASTSFLPGRPAAGSDTPRSGRAAAPRAAGRVSAQISGPPSWARSGQRGWKWQPDGGLTGDGTSPARMTRVRRISGFGIGIADRSACVYGCSAPRRSVPGRSARRSGRGTSRRRGR